MALALGIAFVASAVALSTGAAAAERRSIGDGASPPPLAGAVQTLRALRAETFTAPRLVLDAATLELAGVRAEGLRVERAAIGSAGGPADGADPPSGGWGHEPSDGARQERGDRSGDDVELTDGAAPVWRLRFDRVSVPGQNALPQLHAGVVECQATVGLAGGWNAAVLRQCEVVSLRAELVGGAAGNAAAARVPIDATLRPATHPSPDPGRRSPGASEASNPEPWWAGWIGEGRVGEARVHFQTDAARGDVVATLRAEAPALSAWLGLAAPMLVDAMGGDAASSEADGGFVAATLGLNPTTLAELEWRSGVLEADLRWRPAGGGRPAGRPAGRLEGRLAGSVQVAGLSVEHPSGAPALDGVASRVDWRASGVERAIEWRVDAGAALIGPWYAEWSEDAPWRGVYTQDADRRRGEIQTPAAAGRFDAGADGLWSLDLDVRDLAWLWREGLAPFTGPGVLADLQPDGTARLEANGDGLGPTRARLTGDVARLDDRRDRLSAEALALDFHWARDEAAPVSQWRWRSARLWQLEFGAHASRWQFSGAQLRNEGVVEWPLLDGALRANTLTLDWPLDWPLDGLNVIEPADTPEAGATRRGPVVPGPAMLARLPAVTFEGAVQPISLARLVPALGGPALQGTVAGIIPRVTGTPERLAVDGVLEVDVFDGRVFVRDIVIDDPLGRVPRLAWSAEFSRVDLALLTGALDVGRVEGRVAGYLRDVELIGGTPVALDFWLATDDSVPGRRRISQRAVQNLTDAGGAQAALSRTFLQLFESFGYRRLGIGCRLRGTRCTMRGIGDAPGGGFWIVEGAGLPRLDLIGFEREVDWPVLVERLRSIPEREMEVR